MTARPDPSDDAYGMGRFLDSTWHTAGSDFWDGAFWYDQPPRLLPSTVDTYLRDGEDPHDPAVQVAIGWRYMRARYGEEKP